MTESSQHTQESQPGLPSAACEDCPVYNASQLKKLGVELGESDHLIALAGNPNTGKSTVFNALTGLRQHTGNWPGKTVARAEGGMQYADKRYKLVDLPGTYSLLSTSYDEEIARDFVLFGRPNVTVVVVDATRLERNLNLVLQILELTDRVVVCVNLMDEARRKGIEIDMRALARDLGVPVIGAAARYKEGIPELLEAIREVATGAFQGQPHRIQKTPPALKTLLPELIEAIKEAFPQLPNTRWVALRLLEGDAKVMEAVRTGELGHIQNISSRENMEAYNEQDAPPLQDSTSPQAVELLQKVESLRWKISADIHEQLTELLFTEAARIADRAVSHQGEENKLDWDQKVDRIVTSRRWGIPIMLLLFTLVFWLTISGANVPSQFLADILIGKFYPWLKSMAVAIHTPWWLRGLVLDGMYLATAWVISVMLPPMAIFFPLFTLLEDLGYLPRVAFNLDSIFHKAGAHGKQALSMMMGFGCNAAGVIATRVIDSPRERLLAIITNNFSLCNGRWPTQILLATIFVGVLAPTYLAGLLSTLAVVAIAVLGVLLTFFVSWLLSKTVLRGEASTFSLELPPYRPPRIWQTIYTSLLDRTIFVLWRAIVFALPAGAVIWLSANIHLGGQSIAAHLIHWMDPFGMLLGLNGVILLAYIIAIPANEIIIPTILMLTVLITQTKGAGAGAGVMFEPSNTGVTLQLLKAGGWTLLTAVNVMLFSLIHNPCSTTIYTIYKETGSLKWTLIATLLPLGMGFLVTLTVAQIWHLFV